MEKKLARDLYQLGLGEIIQEFGNPRTSVVGVPGGWIFIYTLGNEVTSAFVPYSSQFLPPEMDKW